MQDELLVKFSVSTSLVGSEVSETINILEHHGVSLETWNTMTKREQNDAVDVAYEDWKNNIVDGWWDFI